MSAELSQIYTVPEIGNSSLQVQPHAILDGLAEVIPIGSLHEMAALGIREAVDTFRLKTEGMKVTDVDPDERDAKIIITESFSDEPTTKSGWRPHLVASYASEDPFRTANPLLTKAGMDLVNRTNEVIRHVQSCDPTNADPTLTYLNLNRSGHGKRSTVITEGLISADEGIAAWIKNLPDAEELSPVAHPWSDRGAIKAVMEQIETRSGKLILKPKIGNDGLPVVSYRPNSVRLSALVGGANDGLAVRERDAWERVVLPEFIDMQNIDGELRITSIGTGTGEPAMDTGLAMAERTEEKTLTVIGYDVNPASLAVAQYVAAKKAEKHNGRLSFVGRIANILTKEGLVEAISSTQPHIVEAIGFTEYVPSDAATSDSERKQREMMIRSGLLSAEEFIGTIYEHMPVGSVFMTGNMRNDSSQAPFVLHGLGWKGIIQRSTEEYMSIFERAGVPASAVNLYMPQPDKSSGVYNLVAIKK